MLERALDAGARPLSLFVEERWLAHERPVIDRLEALDPRFPVYVATNGQFRELTGYEVTRGALAAFARPPLLPLDDVLAGARQWRCSRISPTTPTWGLSFAALRRLASMRFFFVYEFSGVSRSDKT